MLLKIVTKTIDSVGRIALPIEIRRNLNFKIGDEVDIFNDNGAIVIKKHHSSCILCGDINSLKEFNGKFICQNCLNKLKN